MLAIGAGTVERDQRDNVLEPIGTHLDERLAHAGRFQLEHADRLAAPEHLVGLHVVERDLFEIDDDGALLQQLHGSRQRGQRLQAEEVELDETGVLDPFHVELRRRHVRLRILVQRHELVERAVSDHDAGGMGRGVGIQTFELLRDLQQARDLWFGLGRLPQPRLALDRLF